MPQGNTKSVCLLPPSLLLLKCANESADEFDPDSLIADFARWLALYAWLDNSGLKRQGLLLGGQPRDRAGGSTFNGTDTRPDPSNALVRQC